MARTSRWAIVFVCFATACANDNASTPAPAPAAGGAVIATYDDKKFTTEDFRREVERLPPRSRAQLTTPDRRRQFVDNYILNELLAEQGRAKGYDRDPDIVRQIDDLRQRLVVQRVMRDYQEAPVLSDADIKAYYDQNQRLFSGAQVHAAHILVKDEALAKRLRAELDAAPDKFEELAKTNSTDTATAARGGDLGFFGQGRMVAEFERAAFALDKPGDLSQVIQSPFGYHIIKLIERKDGPAKPFEDVKERIRVALTNQRRQELVTQRFDKVKADAKITVDEDALAKVELPNPPPGANAAPEITGH
ncbi:MAG: peptidylprolyl isomerase [Deltaproteobacteria bacterium]|nr:peptidylprolyl isomerase [Deltaproteobacteria bacterium]